MGRSQRRTTKLSTQVSPEVRDAITQICLKQGWVYGLSSPLLSELMNRIATAETVQVGEKSFLLIPLDKNI
jgi:hypothetical protein